MSASQGCAKLSPNGARQLHETASSGCPNYLKTAKNVIRIFQDVVWFVRRDLLLQKPYSHRLTSISRNPRTSWLDLVPFQVKLSLTPLRSLRRWDDPLHPGPTARRPLLVTWKWIENVFSFDWCWKLWSQELCSKNTQKKHRKWEAHKSWFFAAKWGCDS